MCSDAKKPRLALRSIGARLTLWGAGVTFVASALLCITLYVGLFFSLRREVDAFLEGEIREFMLTVNQHPNDDDGLERDIRIELGSRSHHDLAFRLYDDFGRLIATSVADDPLGDLWRQPPDWSRNPPRLRFETINVPDQLHAFRTCSLRVTTADGRRCTAQVSYRLVQMSSSLARFRSVCAAGLGLALILAVVAGRIVARRSLRPIQTLTETTRRIDAKRLAERVPLSGSGDELDLLSETINDMLERIEHHVKQVRQFTADASHELRTPLAALRGAAEVGLSRERSNEDLKQVIADSIEQYDRLSRVAEDLLLLARADAGQNILRRERIRLDAAVADMVDLYRPLAEESGLEIAFSDRADVWIEGDGGRLRQLIGNLLDNAIKYSPAGARITVALRVADGIAHLTISDGGPGILPEHLPRVFDRFYRVEQDRSRKNGGAGLGLSICRTIARAHGGEITMQSIPGSGVSVSVCLPA